AALAVTAGALVMICVTVRRRGGVVPLLWCAVLLGLLVYGLGPSWLSDPWEPHALTVACAALLLLGFEAATGKRWALPAAAALASLLAEAQAGLALFAFVVLGVATVAVVVRGHRPGRSLLVTAGVVAV